MSKQTRFLWSKYRSDRRSWGAIFEAMGPSKNAYFEDVKKLFKMPKNDPKMIQKWFKIAQIV